MSADDQRRFIRGVCQSQIQRKTSVTRRVQMHSFSAYKNRYHYLKYSSQGNSAFNSHRSYAKMKHLTQNINYRLRLQRTEEKSETYWRLFLFSHISSSVSGINITDMQG